MNINDFGKCEKFAEREAEDRVEWATLHRKMTAEQRAELKSAWKDGFMAALGRVREGKVNLDQEVRS